MEFHNNIIRFIIYFTLINILISKDVHTFSNYEIIRRTNAEINFNIDFKNKIINGIIKMYFTALLDGEVIILDTQALKIDSIIDSDTGEELEYILDKQYELDTLGVPLKIYKNFTKDEQITILIKYSTTKEGMSVGWLEPEQTAGKKYPYMFSQGESILNRGLFPTQDTPAVKTTFSVSITVEKPLFALFSGIYQGKIDNGETTTYFYKQKIPIPSYLVAIAAGAIEERVISDRTKIYGEKEIVDLAVYEFEDTEIYIQLAEAYISPYEWGEYNLLILPPSFPYGGMENPTLTFVSPSLISGDKSLSVVIAHEICHSWSGNLVTMDKWSDFWLNEGFDMFIQGKVMENFYNPELVKLQYMSYDKQLNETIISIGESRSLTQLRPYLLGRNPDDYVTAIPYLKGFNFLYYLETIVNSESNIDLFRKILRTYFDKYKYTSIKTENFKELFIQIIKEELPSKADKILAKIDWFKWFNEPGFPPNQNDYSNIYYIELEETISNFYDNKLPSNFTDIFKGWNTILQMYFVNRIRDTNKELDDIQLSLLSNTLNLKEGYNVEITCSYFLIVLLHGPNIEDDVLNALIDFLGKHGRNVYINPTYAAFAQRDRETAFKTFQKYRNFYHPIIVKYLDRLFKLL